MNQGPKSLGQNWLTIRSFWVFMETLSQSRMLRNSIQSSSCATRALFIFDGCISSSAKRVARRLWISTTCLELGFHVHRDNNGTLDTLNRREFIVKAKEREKENHKIIQRLTEKL
ncbi:uncharacterized protein LOC113283720 isoform X1 [Papaver somniferum]|uniref:uncharacterized protein LOC113283720 isoform X1 n=2 Tax=Papaver somniferum TaxID=3469 RepID=UPI000E6FE726|nr:uncharacterized protein LOC113283720 isoform X1 [Papaver somniferum]